MPAEYGLETSALGNILRSESTMNSFCDRVHLLNASVVVCEPSLLECLGAGAAEPAQEQARLFAKMGPQLGSRLAFAVTPRRLYALERKHHRFKNTPTRAESLLPVFQQLAADPSFPRWHAGSKLRVEAFFDKSMWMALEESVAQAQPVPGELKKLLGHFGQRMTADHHYLKLMARDARDRAAMIADPSHHRSHILLAAMSELNALGSVVHGTQGDKPGWLRRELGKWADTMIAANLAYCDIMVVEDRRMRERLEFLRTHQLCFFVTCTLRDFLS